MLNQIFVVAVTDLVLLHHIVIVTITPTVVIISADLEKFLMNVEFVEARVFFMVNAIVNITF